MFYINHCEFKSNDAFKSTRLSSSSGKLDCRYQGHDLHKLRKSMSFGFHDASSAKRNLDNSPYIADEPDVSWVTSLVIDASSARAGVYNTNRSMD